MPAPTTWHRRVPEILETLRSPETPEALDRSDIEILLRVKRRQAIRVLHSAGGSVHKRVAKVSKHRLAQFLRALEDSGAVTASLKKNERVVARLEQARREEAALRARVPTMTRGQLPNAISIPEAGTLQIQFSSPEDLLSRIVQLAEMASNDYIQFEQTLAGTR